MPHKDPEMHKAYAKRYRELNRTRIKTGQFEWRSKHLDASRKYSLKTAYGITPADYDRMALEQEYRCKLCDKLPQTRLVIDHDHITGKIRGLLCNGCNVALGTFGDDPRMLVKALSYLMGEEIVLDAVINE